MHGGEHPLGDLQVRLAPRGRERVAQPPPVLGPAQRTVADAEPLALEAVVGLDQPVVGDDLQAVLGGGGRGGLLRALQRGGEHGGQVGVGERLRGEVGHPAVRRQPEAGQPAVEDPVRVVHLTVAQEVDDGADRPRPASLVSSAGAAARPRGVRQGVVDACQASSSRAVETNHASKALRRRVDPAVQQRVEERREPPVCAAWAPA